MSHQDYIGRRVARWRDLNGMTQQELADKVGRTQGWVSQVENGRMAVTKRDVLISLANALRVDVQQLIAQPSIRTRGELTIRQAVPSLRTALYGPDEPVTPRPTEVVVVDVNRFMAARMACNYATVAALAGSLLAECLALVEAGKDGARARQLLVRTLVTASLAVKPLGYVDLGLALAERALAVSSALGGAVELAASRYALSQATLAAGARRQSLTLASLGAQEIQGCGDADAPAWYGMLNLQSALAGASLGEDPATNLAEARDAAARRPRDGWLMEFSAANVATWESAAALECGEYDQVPVITRGINRAELRTVQRRSALLQNAGRGYYALGDQGMAVRCILAADEISPEEVRTRPTIREIVGQMMRDAHRAAGGSELQDLASRMGVDPLGEV
jgi:transcriptional regulator with XRE-family HTH domain